MQLTIFSKLIFTFFIKGIVINIWVVNNPVNSGEKKIEKSVEKICFLLTRLAYKIVVIIQIFSSHSFIFILNKFYSDFVYYLSIFLLTLQIVNTMLITYLIHYKSIFKVVDNTLIINFKTIIIQKAIV